VLNRVLKRIGVRSRSAPHSHHFQHAPRHDSQPVWLLGAARTGTTTLLYQISAASSRNAVFEPMGPRGAGLGLSDYARESWIGSPAPEDAKRINQWLVKPSRPHSEAPGVSEAANWLRSFYSEVGTNLVVKEIRCVPRCQDLLRAHAIAGEEPILVGVVGHPLGAVYSFYRLRALGLRESLDGSRTDGLWPLRAMRYQSMGFHRELTSIRPKTRIDEVALAVLLDQAELHRLFSAGGSPFPRGAGENRHHRFRQSAPRGLPPSRGSSCFQRMASGQVLQAGPAKEPLTRGPRCDCRSILRYAD